MSEKLPRVPLNGAGIQAYDLGPAILVPGIMKRRLR
jgi:hypothetical protein